MLDALATILAGLALAQGTTRDEAPTPSAAQEAREEPASETLKSLIEGARAWENERALERELRSLHGRLTLALVLDRAQRGSLERVLEERKPLLLRSLLAPKDAKAASVVGLVHRDLVALLKPAQIKQLRALRTVALELQKDRTSGTFLRNLFPINLARQELRKEKGRKGGDDELEGEEEGYVPYGSEETGRRRGRRGRGGRGRRGGGDEEGDNGQEGRRGGF